MSFSFKSASAQANVFVHCVLDRVSNEIGFEFVATPRDQLEIDIFSLLGHLLSPTVVGSCMN